MLAGVAAVLVLAGFFGYRSLWGERVTFESASNSPDGMYRCVVRETRDGHQSEASIHVFRWSRAGKDSWTLWKSKEVNNDSACRSNYSIDWSYDGGRRTTGLTVFGDFGTPPFAGEVIFQASIAGAGAPTSRPSTRSAGAPAMKSNQAMGVILDLPEVQAWDAYIRAKTRGRVHAACLMDNDFPDNIAGRRCWYVVVGEDHPERFVRWQEFAVDATTGEVLVLPYAGGPARTLAQWRGENPGLGVAARLVTKSFEATVYDVGREGEVTSGQVVYHGVDRRTGKDIFLIGRTMHSMGADGQTPSHFLGYTFQNGDVSYNVLADGTLTIVQGQSHVLAEKKGVWQWDP